MPIRVENPSWFSAIRADDKPVYLNPEGAIKTGKNLKGRLVGIAESLGIFKGYVSAYRGREVARNRNAYDAVWSSIAHKYGVITKNYTQKVVKDRGYSRVDPYGPYSNRLRGCDVRDPQRAIVGRELRFILDTARGVDQTLREGKDVTQQQYEGTVVQNDEEVVAQKRRFETWTGSGQGGEKAMETVGNVDGIAEALQDVEMSVGDLAEATGTRDGEMAEASAPGYQADEVGNKPTRVPKELGRTMVADNKKRLHQMLGSERQLRVLAQELGYNPKKIASRQRYIQGKLEKRIESDSRAKSGRLTSNEIHELARSVFDKALGKSTMVVGIRGAMLGVSSKVKHVLAEDNSDQVDVLELSKDKIKVAARDRKYLKKLMTERLGTHNQEVDPARIAHIEHLAIKEATARVRESKVELSSAEVDDVLVHSLRTSFEVGKYKARLRGGLGKASRAVKPEYYGFKRSVADVLEKTADENPRVLVEVADERAEALHEVQQQPEQPGETSSPAVDESVTSPQPAAVAASPASLQPASLPKPQRYKGVDYFDQSVREIIGLGIPVRNHQAAKQVVTDDRYLVASVPEGHSGNELTPAHRKYIETTLLRHVAEHERTKPGTPLDAGDLHRMMKPITARALGIQNDRVLGAKVWYKNVTKHIGYKDTAFSDGLKKLRRNARDKANYKAGLPSFVRNAARKANIPIDIDYRVLRTIRPQVKDMAEAYVNEHRKVLTDAELENFVQIALSGYSLVAVHAPMRDFKW